MQRHIADGIANDLQAEVDLAEGTDLPIRACLLSAVDGSNGGGASIDEVLSAITDLTEGGMGTVERNGLTYYVMPF